MIYLITSLMKSEIVELGPSNTKIKTVFLISERYEDSFEGLTWRAQRAISDFHYLLSTTQ